jgi:hypothetical protein
MPALQPRPKTTRSLRLLSIDGRLVLTITMQHSARRAEEKIYHLTPLPESAGCAFDDFGSCTCLGHRGWRPCKHLAALRKLRELGRI